MWFQVIKGGRKCFADKGRAFKTDVIETVFAFCEVGGGEKQCMVESWQGYCREERASKLLEGAEYRASTAWSLLLPELVPAKIRSKWKFWPAEWFHWKLDNKMPFASCCIKAGRVKTAEFVSTALRSHQLYFICFPWSYRWWEIFLSSPEEMLCLLGCKTSTLTCPIFALQVISLHQRFSPMMERHGTYRWCQAWCSSHNDCAVKSEACWAEQDLDHHSWIMLQKGSTWLW